MGVVYRAKHDDFPDNVALKVLRRSSSVNETVVKRFVREGMTGTTLSHDHVVPVVDVGETDDYLFLAMPYIDGFTLEEIRAHIWEGKRSAADSSLVKVAAGLSTIDGVVKLAKEVLSALEHVHRQGIIHRDVSPSNILIDHSGKAWLADFGLAKLNGSVTEKLSGVRSSVDPINTFLGTPRYASPEQRCGGSEEVCGVITARSDIFSFGIVLHEFLLNQMPFSGYLTYRYRRPFDVPKWLTNVLKQATRAEAGQRYSSAQKMSDAIQLAYSSNAVENASTKRRSKKSYLQIARGILSTSLGLAVAAFLIFGDAVDTKKLQSFVQRLSGRPAILEPAVEFETKETSDLPTQFDTKLTGELR